MCILDNLEKSKIDAGVLGLTKAEEISCDMSIIIRLHNSAKFYLCKSNEDDGPIYYIDDNCSWNNIERKANSNNENEKQFDRLILLSNSPTINTLLRLKNMISVFTSIKGNHDSFATIGYCKGNYLKNETDISCDDFVTPGNTIDIQKLYEVLRIITNKKTNI